jgi:hypothetical protein
LGAHGAFPLRSFLAAFSSVFGTRRSFGIVIFVGSIGVLGLVYFGKVLYREQVREHDERLMTPASPLLPFSIVFL